MERLVATATTRNYREQRRMGVPMQSLPNDCAEASLSPLWRTLDRLHHQSASQNLAFRSALIRLAISMKKLYRAYIAAHALAIVNRARSPLSPTDSIYEGDHKDESSAQLQSRRIIVHRIITASAGYSKQFLGLQRSSSQHLSTEYETSGRRMKIHLCCQRALPRNDSYPPTRTHPLHSALRAACERLTLPGVCMHAYMRASEDDARVCHSRPIDALARGAAACGCGCNCNGA